MGDQIHERFDHTLNKWSVFQTSRLRALEDALRDESKAVFNKLRDEVSALSTTATSSKSPLDAIIDDLFARNEVSEGLVGWLQEGSEGKLQAGKYVKELHADIAAGLGNDIRTTVNHLLPIYMDALGVRDVLVSGASTSSSGKGKPTKFLGELVNNWMMPFLEELQSNTSANGDFAHPSFTLDDSPNSKANVNRLRAALIAIWNTGNFASHNRGKLTFCQRLELCGAIGAMAETLPKIAQLSEEFKTSRFQKTQAVSPVKETTGTPFLTYRDAVGSPSKTPITSIQGENEGNSSVSSVYVSYYWTCLVHSPKRAKYAAILEHMKLVPKARLCADSKVGHCGGVKICAESHSKLEAMQFNPVAITLSCPVPEKSRNDYIHANSLCLFKHNDIKSGGTVRYGKTMLCWAMAKCKNNDCLKAHSEAEVCWFNPKFRVADCTEGQQCTRKRWCSAFHKEYHTSKRQPGMNEYVGEVERMLFPERTLAALLKTSPVSIEALPRVSSAIQSETDVAQYFRRYAAKLQTLTPPEQQKYDMAVKQMLNVPKARLCANCTGENCPEAHSQVEVLTFNPLLMVLGCPVPSSQRHDDVHLEELCPFAHGAKPPKEFMKAKRLLCALQAECKDKDCVKSHSLGEVCWFWPEFRVNKCPQGDACKRQEHCSYYHEEHHSQRTVEMNNFVGKAEPALFVERAYSELSKLGVQAPHTATTLPGDDEELERAEADNECPSESLDNSQTSTESFERMGVVSSADEMEKPSLSATQVSLEYSTNCSGLVELPTMEATMTPTELPPIDNLRTTSAALVGDMVNEQPPVDSTPEMMDIHPSCSGRSTLPVTKPELIADVVSVVGETADQAPRTPTPDESSALNQASDNSIAVSNAMEAKS